MRRALLMGLVLTCVAVPGLAQEKPRELKVRKTDATFGVTCFQSGKRVLIENFQGPPKIELYGDFVVFSGQRLADTPQAVVMTLGTVCMMEEVAERR